MSPPGRPKGEFRSAQHEGTPVRQRRDLLTPLWRHTRTAPQFSVRDWERVIGQARRTRLLARLAQHCIDLDLVAQLPAGAWRHLASELVLVQRQRAAVHWELDCITRALAALDTPVVLLKGAAYLMADLPASRGRVFNDIDILVDRRQIDAVESALMAAGWIAQERDAYNQRYYRTWMHELPPLRHVTRHSVIDVHHTITPPTSRFAVDGGLLLQHVRPLRPGSPLAVLQPLDMVLHSAAHLFGEGEFDHGLRDLLDMDDLLLHFQATEPDFWPRLLQRAAVLGLQVPLYHALMQVQRLFGTTPPPAVAAAVQALQPNAVARLAMGWALGQALQPMHPSCDTASTAVARFALYVRSHWIRMPAHLVLRHLLRKAWMQAFPPKDANPTLSV
ncbi:MAG: nucleotidyltransferase family protein [Pseudomonadota bacterium]